jgi:hypothetical protein
MHFLLLNEGVILKKRGLDVMPQRLHTTGEKRRTETKGAIRFGAKCFMNYPELVFQSTMS